MFFITLLTAFFLPICKQECPCHNHLSKHVLPHHVTLVHLNTKNPKILKKTNDKIFQYIESHSLVKLDRHGRKIINFELGKEGPNSTKLKGDIEIFKKNLHYYLINDPSIAPYISAYRVSHVDRYGYKNIPYYYHLRIEDVKVFPH